MLYSKEKIWINDTEREVFLYLKKTRNHSYRITANKISLTLPQIYKNPETIRLHKESLLKNIRERIAQNPQLIPKERLLERQFIEILSEKFFLTNHPNPIKFSIDFKDKTIQLSSNLKSNSSKLSKEIINHYQHRIDQRVRYINHITLSKSIISVEIKNNQSSWGLCSSKGEITISVNTLFAPIWVLDYVIVHELCHLVHHDHSIHFWRLVEKYYPKFKQAKQYLKENGNSLML